MSTMESENSTRHDAQTSTNLATHFFRLPGELRNQIYAYIFSTDVTFSIVRKTRPNGKPTKRGIALHRHSFKPCGVSLLFVCRQMYHDTSLLLYTQNSFHCITLTVFTNMLEKFPSDQRAALRKLHLKIRDTDQIKVGHFLDVMGDAAMTFAKLLPNVRHVKLDIDSCSYGMPKVAQDVAAAYDEQFRIWLEGSGVVTVDIPLYTFFTHPYPYIGMVRVMVDREQWRDGAIE